MVWLLGAATTSVSTLFRTVVFGSSLFEIGNIATVPTLIVCVVLASTRNRLTHAVLIPALFVIIFLDIVLVTAVQS